MYNETSAPTCKSSVKYGVKSLNIDPVVTKSLEGAYKKGKELCTSNL